MAFLSGIFAKIIAVFISLITFITGLFGGIFAPPVDGYVALENTLISIETGKYLIIGSYDEFIDTVGEIKNETKKYDEEYFETKSLKSFLYLFLSAAISRNSSFCILLGVDAAVLNLYDLTSSAHS